MTTKHDIAVAEKLPIITAALIPAFWLAVTSLVMPFKILLFSIHNVLTKRDYTYSVDDFCDLGLGVCVGVWIYMYITWSKLDYFSDAVQNNNENYTLWTLIKEQEGDFSIIYFLIVMIIIMWLRFLLMLQLTKTFGPLLRTSLVMLGDAFKFLFIWLVVLALLSSIASLLFGDIEG